LGSGLEESDPTVLYAVLCCCCAAAAAVLLRLRLRLNAYPMPGDQG
jgi:hypothetical protein